MSKKKQPELYDDSLQEIKESKGRVKAIRKDILAGMDSFGTNILDARKRLGYPAPKDQREFGKSLLVFHMGLIELYQASLVPGFSIEKVPAVLRRALTNPITEKPATDEELESHLELLKEREELIEAMTS